MSPSTVLISEVGPRDGLQSVPSIMPTDAKLRWIEALFAAGLPDASIYGMTPEAGLTVGFRYADGRSPRVVAAPMQAESQ